MNLGKVSDRFRSFLQHVADRASKLKYEVRRLACATTAAWRGENLLVRVAKVRNDPELAVGLRSLGERREDAGGGEGRFRT